MGKVFGSATNTQIRHILLWAKDQMGNRTSISQNVSTPTVLAPGNYVLDWAFSGSGAISVDLYEQIAGGWNAYPNMTLNMPPGVSQMASWTPGCPYPPYNFVVV